MKKAIVIGATSGIGKELALLLADNNYLVGITGRRKNLLDEMKTTRSNSFVVACFDISYIEQTTKHLHELTLQMGGLDLLILNSGICLDNSNLDFAIEQKTIAVNVTGFTTVADWAINFFETQKSGHFAAITSIAGHRGNADAPSYNASKAFQTNYLKSLQQRIHRSRLPVYVTDIRPGYIATTMLSPDRKTGVISAAKAAQLMLQAIEIKKTVAYVPKLWAPVSLIFRMLPTWLQHRI